MALRSPAKGKVAKARRAARAKPAPAGKQARPARPARAGRPAKPARTGKVAQATRPAVRRPAPPVPAAARPAAPPLEKPAPLREQVLERMRQKLLAKRTELVSGVRESNRQSIQASEELIQDIADQASTAYTKEFLLSIGDTERRLLQQVDDALQKIRRKSYGLCERCGEPIGEKRLEALPFAKLCIRCQEEEERR
ncbi:MAG TPA: TraR/DksA family transcriptional regulator [Candidatus Methylomirabilis sp.]